MAMRPAWKYEKDFQAQHADQRLLLKIQTIGVQKQRQVKVVQANVAQSLRGPSWKGKLKAETIQ